MRDICKHCGQFIRLVPHREDFTSTSVWRHPNGLMLCVPHEDDPAFTGTEVAEPIHGRGVYGLACFNGLSTEQQTRVVTVGNLPIGYVPEGECLNGAEVEVITKWDEYPGPRFYCLPCAIMYLRECET